MDWLELIKFLTSFGIGVGALSYLTKRIIEHSLTKDLDRFKTNLQSEHDREIERLRADLRVVAFGQETRLAALHARRAEIIEELYRQIATLHDSFNDLLSPIQYGGDDVQAKKRGDLVASANNFFTFFNTHRIYFDEPFCESVDELKEMFRVSWIEFNHHSEFSRQRPGKFPDAEEWDRIWKRFGEEVPPLKRAIEGNLRALIGVSNEPQQKKL